MVNRWIIDKSRLRLLISDLPGTAIGPQPNRKITSPEYFMNEQTSELTCPFCNESGFDAPGLKRHCEMYCDVWPTVERITSPFDRISTRPAPSPIVQAADEMEKALKELYSHTGGMPVAEMYGNSAQYEHALGIYERALAALEHYAKAKHT
jgi:hypothetical protein